jgi:hypothetical protein
MNRNNFAGRNLFNRVKSKGGKTFCFMFLLVLFPAAGFFILPKIVLAEGKEFIINEIMVNPPNGETEWIEVYANKDINFLRKEGSKTDNKKINNFYICSKKGEGGCDPSRISFIYLPEGESSLSIKKGEFFIIARDDKAFEEKYGGTGEITILKSDSKFDLLKATDKNALADYSFGEEIKWEGEGNYYNENSEIKSGYSLELDGKTYIQSCDINGTPGNPYKKCVKKVETNNSPDILFKKDDKIYKNIYADFEFITSDKNQKVTWEFGDGHKSYLQKTRHKYEEEGIYQASLKLRGGSDNAVKSFTAEVEKFDRLGIKITSIKANPKGKDVGRETIKIKNISKKKINLKNWSVATGWKELYNHPINKKVILKPGETKELTRKYSAFTLNNKQTKIELRRPDGSVASKVKYSKREEIQDDEVYEKTNNGWEWNAPTNANKAQTSPEESRTDTELKQTNTDNAQMNEEDLLEENSSDSQNIQTENSEIQTDEPVENSDTSNETVLGISDVKENKADSKGFFASMVLNTNQLINSLINFFF